VDFTLAKAMTYYYITREQNGFMQLNKASGYNSYEKLEEAVKQANLRGGTRYITIPIRCLKRLIGHKRFVALEKTVSYHKEEWKGDWPGMV
jgi:hypothetical protein